jgi:hypothetical protein
MPQQLREFRVDDVSLVDAPANAEVDPVTKRKIARSTVVIRKRATPTGPWTQKILRMCDQVTANGEKLGELRKSVGKRQSLADLLVKRRKVKDDPGTQDVDADPPGQADSEFSPRSVSANGADLSTQPQPDNNDSGRNKKKKSRKEKDMSLKKVLVNKSATAEDLYKAVEAKAKKIALKKNCNPQLVEGRLWEKIYKATGTVDAPRIAKAAAGAPVLRRQPKMARITSAEAELDKRARKLMTSTGLSYAKCVEKTLMADPSLYDAYESELAAGKTYPVPEASQDFSAVGKLAPGDYRSDGADDTDDDECPECGEGVSDGDDYCSSCGADLNKKSKRR